MVIAFVRTPEGGEQELPVAPSRNDLAGFESWRRQVYGSPAAQALGLALLPLLASQEVYAEGEQLDLLEREVWVMLANTALWPDIDAEGLRFRLLNILEAIRVARETPGAGVYIG